jgi:hypothetical protein
MFINIHKIPRDLPTDHGMKPFLTNTIKFKGDQQDDKINTHAGPS